MTAVSVFALVLTTRRPVLRGGLMAAVTAVLPCPYLLRPSRMNFRLTQGSNWSTVFPF